MPKPLTELQRLAMRENALRQTRASAFGATGVRIYPRPASWSVKGSHGGGLMRDYAAIAICEVSEDVYDAWGFSFESLPDLSGSVFHACWFEYRTMHFHVFIDSQLPGEINFYYKTRGDTFLDELFMHEDDRLALDLIQELGFPVRQYWDGEGWIYAPGLHEKVEVKLP